MLSVGLMSGTSMDGIDAALLETDGRGQIRTYGHHKLSYAASTRCFLKAAERAVKWAKGDLVQASQHYQQRLHDYLVQELFYSTDTVWETIQSWIKTLPSHLQIEALSLHTIIQLSTELHAQVVLELLQQEGLSPAEVDVIGYHGQTVFHCPEKKQSIQLGDGALLAELTRIAVVNDFRQQDIQAGGLGAPFAPIYHQALAIRDRCMPLVVVNCGGIANISVILGPTLEQLYGFDTGPGNGLIDAFVRQRTQGRLFMDSNGQFGQRGVVHEAVLHLLYEWAICPNGQNFLKQKPPKALDIRDMQLISALDTLSLEDGCATLETFTAETIVDSLYCLPLTKEQWPRHWVLAGGGWYNPMIKQALLKKLNSELTQANVQTCEEMGWQNDALEAQIFAYFAVRHLKNLPLSAPTTTGVPQPVSGGVLHRL